MERVANDSDETIWVEPFAEGNVRLVLDQVVGETVFVRQIDPADGEPERVELRPGHYIEVCTPISHVSLNGSGEVGANDCLYWLRVVPDGRRAGIALGRTLRHGEVDDGRRVHLRPGEQFQLPSGSVTVELDVLDEFYRNVEPDRPEGSLSAALRVWFGLGVVRKPTTRLLAIAAAHRFDAATHLLGRSVEIRERLDGEDNIGGPQFVVSIDELIHLTQEGIVALARCIALIDRGRSESPFVVEEDSAIAENKAAIKAIRDAYEHIDERAVGNLRNAVFDTRAYMIFDHLPLVRENRIQYLDHDLDLSILPVVLSACRASIKALAGGPPIGKVESA